MTAPATAVTGRILDDNEASLADATALSAEAALFKSIGMGIALSITRCGDDASCIPHVSKDEVGHLLDTLDKRILDLATREQQQQGAYTDVITTYVTQREEYLRYQAELEKFAGMAAQSEDTGTGDIFSDTGAPGADAGIDASIFSDADAPIEDEE